MTDYHVPDDVAWVTDGVGQIQLTHLATGRTRSLGGAAAVLFGDVVAGTDPVQAAAVRWPHNPGASAAARTLLDQLVSGGFLRTHTPARAAAPLPTVEPLEAPAPHTGPYRVLFVCTANICRSAYADAYANRQQRAGLEFVSAGTNALVGQAIDPPMAAQLPSDAPRSHRATQLTVDLAQSADLILALAEEHRGFILEDWPRLASRTFLIGHAARELSTLPTDATLAEVAPHLWQHRSERRGDAVRDPYRRGDAAAAECATLIRAHVDAIVAQLESRAGR